MNEINGKILIVDDELTNLILLQQILSSSYQTAFTSNSLKVFEIAEQMSPDIILLDIMMPEMDGFDVLKQLKSTNSTRGIPVIFLTSMNQTEYEIKGIKAGAVDYITKPVNADLVLARVKTHISLKLAMDALGNQNEFLEQKVKERTKQLQITRDVTIRSLSALAETRDNETGNHIIRTQNYVKLLSVELGKQEKYSSYMNEETIDLLQKSAPLHDIGKVGIPDIILLKPGKLNDEEFEIMKKHAAYGYEALSRAEAQVGTSSFLHHAKKLAYSHHEKWDGSGYPRGLKGKDIPIEGRIMAIADVYDALISKRVYKLPFPHSKSVGIIIDGRGTHFDPDIVDAFINVSEDFRRTALEFVNYDEEKKILDE